MSNEPQPQGVHESTSAQGEQPVERSGGESYRLRLNPMHTGEAIKPIPSISDLPPAIEIPSGPAPVAEEAAPEPEKVAAPKVEEAPLAEVTVPKREPVAIPREAGSLDAEMEAEIAAALASGEMPTIPTQAEVAAEGGAKGASGEEALAQGNRIRGKVQSINGDDIFIDFGLRSPGLLSSRQFANRKLPDIGQSLEVLIDKVDEGAGIIQVSMPFGSKKISGDWDSVTVGQVVDAVVSKTNKGGLEVAVSSLRGFIPAGQVDLGFAANLETFVGQKLRCKVMEVNAQKRRLVLSRRQLMMEERQETEGQMLEKLAPGQKYMGRVKTVKDYGAFVDIGGIDGLLHVGQISWQRVKHPSEILQEGQEIEVQVLSVDKEKKKIGLGMRQLSQNPWVNAINKYAKGATVHGKVTRTEQFGAFVELEPGLEGLVHISELDHQRVRAVTDVVKVGNEMDLQVLEIDPGKKRISLSLKSLKAKPEMPKDEDLAPSKGETYQRKRKEPLRGGNTSAKVGGGLFGNPRDYDK